MCTCSTEPVIKSDANAASAAAAALEEEADLSEEDDEGSEEEEESISSSSSSEEEEDSDLTPAELARQKVIRRIAVSSKYIVLMLSYFA